MFPQYPTVSTAIRVLLATSSAFAIAIYESERKSRDIWPLFDLRLNWAGGLADHSRVDLLPTDHGSAQMLRRRNDSQSPRAGAGRPRRDRGVTFIELLVSIVLLGTAVVATLAAAQAAIIGSTTERDHARAHEWLQSASEILVNDVAFIECESSSPAAIQTAYQAALRSNGSIVPADWGSGQLTISAPVRFAQANGTYDSTCVADIDRQLVTIQVVDTDGKIVEIVEVVVVP